MPNPLCEVAVWDLLERFSERVRNANLPGFRALFLIGSLAGGYYKPGQSDVDLVTLFAGSRPAEDEYGRQAKTIESLFAESTGKVEIENLPRYESDLAINPISGLYANPDLVARLLTQSRLLAGSYDLSKLKMPGPRDFQADFSSQLVWWQAEHGPVEACPPPLQAKYLLLVLRYRLAVLRGQFIYNKTNLISAYQQAKPNHALTHALEHFLAQYLKADPIESGYEKELLTFCGQLSTEIISAQF